MNKRTINTNILSTILVVAGLLMPILLLKNLLTGKKSNKGLVFLCGFLLPHGLRAIISLLENIPVKNKKENKP